jgi:hypothetical protein
MVHVWLLIYASIALVDMVGALVNIRSALAYYLIIQQFAVEVERVFVHLLAYAHANQGGVEISVPVLFVMELQLDLVENVQIVEHVLPQMCARRVWADGEVPIANNLSVLDFLRIRQHRYVLEDLEEHNVNYQYVLEACPIVQQSATIERVHAQIMILVFVHQVYGLDFSVQLLFVMESLQDLVRAQLEAHVLLQMYVVVVD